MYIEEQLIDVIKLGTGYTNVVVADEQEINIRSLLDKDLPRIDVGHLGIKLENPQDISANGYDEIQNPRLLVTQVKFLCKRVDFPEVFSSIDLAVKGFTPFVNDTNYGHLCFVEASIAVKDADRVWWVIHYALQFPRIS